MMPTFFTPVNQVTFIYLEVMIVGFNILHVGLQINPSVSMLISNSESNMSPGKSKKIPK